MSLLRKLIQGTPLEPPARRVLRMFREFVSPPVRSEWDLRAHRDDENLLRILRSTLTATSNCVDIGAHLGTFLRRFVELSPKGQHYAFEPLPELAAALVQEYPRVHVYRCALGDQTGQVSFQHVPEMPGWSGLKRQAYPARVEPKTIEVEIKRCGIL